MQDEWFRSGEGFFIIYAIVERRTLEEAARLREKVLRIKNKDKVAMVLCGNKADLEHERQVPASEGKNLAAKWGKYWANNHKNDLHIFAGCPFFETSAKNHSNITEAFEALVREVRLFRKTTTVGGVAPAPTGLGKKGKKRCILF